MGFSSMTSIFGWLLKIVSKSVVPDLGKPIINIGFFSSFSILILLHSFKFFSLKKFILFSITLIAVSLFTLCLFISKLI